MKPNFTEETKRAMYAASSGYCQCSKECVEPISEFHHVFPNTKVNNKKYPLFLQSPFNCCPIFRDHHVSNRPTISENLVIVYEEYLRGISE